MVLDISPLTSIRLISNNATNLRDSFDTVNEQIATGNKFRDYSGFAAEGNLESFLSFESVLQQIDSFKRSNQTASSIVNTAISTIDTLVEEARDFAVSVAQRRSGANGEEIPLDLIGNAALSRVASALNTQFGNKFIFAGSKTNTQPVQDITSSNVDSSNLSNITTGSAYYSGDTRVQVVRSDEDEEIEYTVAANEEGFQNLIGAIHLAIEGHQQNDDRLLSAANDLINQAADEIIAINATLQTNQERIERVDENIQGASIIIEENFSEIASVDILSKTAESAELEAIIEATFIALNRASGLALANFL